MTLLQRLTRALGTHRVLKTIGLYPPYLGAGVRVTRAAPALDELEVEMTLRPWTRNYVGTHFGGSLYSMCDPFYMLMVLERLGPGYIVWDKSASIDFLKPGLGTVRAKFVVTDERLAEIRDEVEREGKSRPRFEVEVKDEEGAVVARIGKVLSVRKKASRTG